MKLLVLAGETVNAAQLRDALGPDVDPEAAEVMVVAPALTQGALRFWMSDADEAISRAERVSTDTVSTLEREGVSASGDTGEADPETAITDALQSFPADRIVIFTSAGASRYREDLDPAELEARYGRPVTRVEL